MSIQRFIEKVCVQTAVYWEYIEPDGFGQPTFENPVEIKCRWTEDEKVTVDDDGREFISKAEILTPINLKRESYLYLGTLADISSELNPQEVEGASKIIRFMKIPMIKSTSVFVRKAFL